MERSHFENMIRNTYNTMQFMREKAQTGDDLHGKHYYAKKREEAITEYANIISRALELGYVIVNNTQLLVIPGEIPVMRLQELRDEVTRRREAQARGAMANNSKLTAEERSVRAKKAAKARWEREEMAKMEEREFSTNADLFIIHYNDGERSEELWHKLELFTQEYNRRNSTNISVEEFIKKNTR